jgi:hypothetical protein
MREYYRIMGPARFTVFFGGLTALITSFAAAGVWLMNQIGWPEAYGFSCRGRGCWVDHMWNSPKLLKQGRALEQLLFAHFWLIPCLTASIVGVVLLNRWLKRRRTRIRPLDY